MTEFKMKDQGQVHFCLGMQICCDLSSGCITKDQEKCIYETLERSGTKDCNESSTPLDYLFLMSSKDKMVELNVPYREFIGSLMHIAQRTRLDVAYAVGVLSRFNGCYDKIRWTAAKRLLRYLKGTAGVKLSLK